ncbi:MAG: phosphoglycerate dehydrogenase [Lachnospiraceae bacterium]|nr:phosphoglycerate dehydrogenase [Lachnospiraceae bacterium]
MEKTIWLNLDSEKVDVTYLDAFFEKKGWKLIKKPIPAANEEITIEMGLQADAVISTWEPWNTRTLEAVKDKTKYIVRYGAGLDNIDIPAATRAGIYVGNVPGANSPAVAETALLHMLNVLRRFAHCTEGCKKGIWPSTITGNELDGKTVGLLGFGNIGKQLVRMMKGFDVKVLVYDAYFPDRNNEKYGVTFVDNKEELFRECDILSLHVPMNEETKGMINKEVFAMMKPSAYLINTCRGGVVNEADLIEALEQKQIQGAGLDVLVEEPPKADNPLLAMDNVFITSHMGAASLESEHRSQVIIADCIADFFDGNIPYNVKNR